MKRWILLTICLTLFFTWAVAQEKTYYDNSYARMSYVSGDTYVQRANDLGSEAGTVNLAVIAGDMLGTREGRAEIHFGEQNFLRMDRNTLVDVIQLPTPNQDFVKLHLKKGEVFLRISYLAEAQGFELHTRDASFYALEEGLYRIRTGEAGETELRVIEGTMEAAGENTSEEVYAMQRVVASEGRFIFGPAQLASRYADSFSDWNRGRDALLARPAGRSYLPDELGAYERELADGGRWTYESPYGYVWIPHVYHETWRPYCYGRWVWYPVIGYTWVSSYNWGWCVSHYGRWQWRFGLGWYWIPRGGWGPAWVHWHHGAHHYGWCAMSYHGYPGVIINNHYYGDRYYGAYSLDSRTMVTVRKSQLQNPNISRVALSRSQTRGMGKVQFSSRQPAGGSVAASSRSAGMARVSSKSSLRTYERSSTSRAASGTRSRVAGASQVSPSRSTSPGRSSSARIGTSTRSSSSASRTSRGVYPSRSTSASRSSTARTGTSIRSTPGSRMGTSQGRAAGSARASGTYPSRTSRGVASQHSGSRSGVASARSYPSRSSGSTNRSTSASRSSRGAYPSRSGVSTRSSSSASRSSRGAYPSRSGTAQRSSSSASRSSRSAYPSRGSVSTRSSSSQRRSSASSPAGYRAPSSSRGSQSVRSAPRSSSYSSGSRARSSYRSGGSISSRSSSRSGSLSRSTPRASTSRGSSSMRSSGRSTRSSSRSSGSARGSSASRSGSRVRKK